MQKIQHSIYINAPKETVWHAMLDDQSYREWTAVFEKGSHYEGDWSEGSRMMFLSSNDQYGMVSRIAESRAYDFISIEHLGVIENGVEDLTSEKVRQWEGAHENYTFTEKDGGTEVRVDMDIEDEYKEQFEDLWPKALQALKELAEK